MRDRDRLWQEGWKASLSTGVLTRIKDGTQAHGWYQAAEIEAMDRRITTAQFLQMEPKFKMIPIADTIPPMPPIPQATLEALATVPDEPELLPGPKPGDLSPTLVLAYVVAAFGLFLILTTSGIIQAAGVAGVVVGSAVVGFWLRDS
jgi:hypothetical protein